MKKLNVAKICEHTGLSEEELCNELELPLSDLMHYKDGEPVPHDVISRILDIFSIANSDLWIGSEPKKNKAYFSNLNDTWHPSQMAKNDLVEYIKQGIFSINEDTIQQELLKIQKCVASLKKPKISFAGQSDAGKSTLINQLLGAEHMPAKYTPTTSIVVYIIHTSDRPDFINDSVWIFGKCNNNHWDDSKLNDESYCKQFLVAKGDYSLLETYGTHQRDEESSKIATSAVVFIDSPLLKDCDIMDLPGFAANSEDDALHKFNTQDSGTDILIYLSQATHFLQERDRDYLCHCIDTLRPIERNGKNNVQKLENLFIVASQSGAADHGNNATLKQILDTQCHELCKILAAGGSINKLLPKRSSLTGYDYTEEDLKNRFFTYEKESPFLCKKFVQSFSVLVEKFPKAIHEDFCENLRSMTADSNDIIKKRILEYESMIAEREDWIRIAKEMEENEPARRAEQLRKNKEIISFIEKLSQVCKQEIQDFYNSYLTESNIVRIIENGGYKNKKDDKEAIASLICRTITEKVQAIIKKESQNYSTKIEEYLVDYDNSFGAYTLPNGVHPSINAKASFGAGLAGIGALGALGASATWLATSFTAWSAVTFGSLLGWGPILAVSGVIGIAISAVIGTVIAFFKQFNWNKDFAKQVIKCYDEKNVVGTLIGKSEDYWSETQQSFEIAIGKIEEDWKAKSLNISILLMKRVLLSIKKN